MKWMGVTIWVARWKWKKILKLLCGAGNLRRGSLRWRGRAKAEKVDEEKGKGRPEEAKSTGKGSEGKPQNLDTDFIEWARGRSPGSKFDGLWREDLN